MSNTDFECIICFQMKPNNDKIMSPCVHGPYCTECFEQIMRLNGECSICRTSMRTNSNNTNYSEVNSDSSSNISEFANLHELIGNIVLQPITLDNINTGSGSGTVFSPSIPSIPTIPSLPNNILNINYVPNISRFNPTIPSLPNNILNTNYVSNISRFNSTMNQMLSDLERANRNIAFSSRTNYDPDIRSRIRMRERQAINQASGIATDSDSNSDFSSESDSDSDSSSGPSSVPASVNNSQDRNFRELSSYVRLPIHRIQGRRVCPDGYYRCNVCIGHRHNTPCSDCFRYTVVQTQLSSLNDNN